MSIELLIAQIDADSLRDAQRHITAWMSAALKAKDVHFPNTSIDSLLEFKTMLEENIERWFQEQQEKGHQQGLERGLEQGLEQGIVLATRAHLLKLLDLKFGPREGREAEFNDRPLAELELALERILFADREDDLWT